MADNEPPKVEMTRRTVSPPNLPTVYANGFQIALGPFDVRLFLLETSPVGPKEVVDKELVAVIMAPEALKLLADRLGNFVALYEKEFGKIREVATSYELVKGSPISALNTPPEKKE